LVVLSNGVGVMASGGFSVPDADHPDAGFELFMPSTLFTGDVDTSREAWPFKGLNFLIGYTSDEDVDWPSRVGVGPVVVTYVPNYSNDAPDEWRGVNSKGEDLLGVLVGVRYGLVPEGMPGVGGTTVLVGVIPARPAEWEFLRQGGDERRTVLAQRLAALSVEELASPTRPAVV